jgi:arabinan endo-1,5-alpha-L-arabinosidase
MDAIGRLLLTALAASLAACAPLPREGGYANPVLARDFPDPAVLQAPDGNYYAYATQSIGPSSTVNIQAARSRNLVDWEYLGEVLPEKPAWSRDKQDFWAPHVHYDPALATYFMYYSAEPDSQRGKCLAVATSAHPGGPFADSGRPLLCGEGFEHIDPMAFDDPRTGSKLLYWGSGLRPIRVRELSSSRLEFAAGSSAVHLIVPGSARRDALIEGAWIAYRAPHYFLYFSVGRCCGPQAQYSVRVARSTAALGPFELYPAAIVAGNASWRAPGHNSIAVDARGDEWLLYHAMGEGRASERWLLLDRISYRDGWPRIEGDQPSAGPRPVPRVAP